MWITSTFGSVFTGFAALSGAAAVGLTWAAQRGSWRRAAAVSLGALAAAALLWAAAAARVPFAGAYLASTAAWFLAAAGAPGGFGALQARLRPAGAPVRSLASSLAAAAALWVLLAFFGATFVACSLDAECF